MSGGFVSVVFVDLVGFTARAEKLDPEDVQAVLGPYHEHVRRELQSFGGTVEKFIGDAIMAVFGAPTAYGDDAERAVRGALAVRDSTLELDARELHLDLQLRIAVNTGEALVALGARVALGESLVAGDVVNTASRLQSGRARERRDRRRRDVRGHEGRDRVRADRGGPGEGQVRSGRGLGRAAAHGMPPASGSTRASSSAAPASSTCCVGSGSGSPASASRTW